MRILSLKFSLISIFLFLCFAASANDVEFDINVPNVVSLDEVFRVEFSLNDTPQDFAAPSFEGFDVLAGPSTSQGQSISIVNGNMTKTVNYTYTYVLQAQKEGSFTIEPASVKVDKNIYSTKSVKVQVVSGQSNTATQSSNNASRQNNSANAPTATLAQDDILLRTIVDKRSVFKGEPVRVTVKIYFRAPIRLEEFKSPVFNGFWSQEIQLKRQQSQRETLNSKVYESQVLQQYLIFPQQSGELTIDEINATVVAQIMSNNRQRQSLIDDFFGMGSVQEVRRVLKAQPIKIEVKELPSGAPMSFSGAVGSFKLNSDFANTNITANSSATYTLRLSGEGNIPLIQAPKLNLPTSFETYTMKTTESLNTTANGISGYRQFEYPFIARSQGEYTIAPVEFTYFDPKTAKYVTLNTPALQLDILPDTTSRGVSSGTMISGLSREDYRILSQDIRHIKTGVSNLKAKDKFFFASASFFVILSLQIVLFVFLLIFLNKLIKQRKNQVFVKGKKANKVALQRFKAASVFMKQDDKRCFYEEMLRALWGYVSDKLNIPSSSLTKDNVMQELIKRNVTQEEAEKFTSLISGCEYAQYSPDTSSKMSDYFDQGVTLISKYESIIK